MQSSQLKDLDKKVNECFIDKKTGLNNATGLYYLMKNLHKQYERYEENWSFIIFNTDIHKYVNSNCSNLVQDDIDIITSDILKKICRDSDILSFCEGGKFCILTRVFEGDDTIKFARKILKNLTDTDYNGCRVSINAKFGVTFSKNEDTPKKIMERAQKALLKSENTNENIVLST